MLQVQISCGILGTDVMYLPISNENNNIFHPIQIEFFTNIHKNMRLRGIFFKAWHYMEWRHPLNPYIVFLFPPNIYWKNGNFHERYFICSLPILSVFLESFSFTPSISCKQWFETSWIPSCRIYEYWGRRTGGWIFV